MTGRMLSFVLGSVYPLGMGTHNSCLVTTASKAAGFVGLSKPSPTGGVYSPKFSKMTLPILPLTLPSPNIWSPCSLPGSVLVAGPAAVMETDTGLTLPQLTV